MRTIAILAWRIVFILDTLRYQELNQLYIKASQLLCNLISIYKAKSRLSLSIHTTLVEMIVLQIYCMQILFNTYLWWQWDNDCVWPISVSLSLSLSVSMCVQCKVVSVQCTVQCSAVFSVHRSPVFTSQCGFSVARSTTEYTDLRASDTLCGNRYRSVSY